MDPSITYLVVTTALALTAFAAGANAHWGAAGEAAAAAVGVLFGLAASATALGTGLAGAAREAAAIHPVVSTVLMLAVLLTPAATWVVLIRNKWKEAIPLTAAWVMLIPLLTAGVVPGQLGAVYLSTASGIARVTVANTQGLVR